MRNLSVLLIAVAFAIGGCSKDEKILKESTTHYIQKTDPQIGPHPCTGPNGVACGVCSWGGSGCTEITECQNCDENSHYAAAVARLLANGEITEEDLEDGSIITHPELLEALRQDGLPIN